MTFLLPFKKRRSRLQFAKHSELPEILDEAKADAIVAEILAKRGDGNG
jgi:hypothetical protein